jgi:hypothetical protein
MAAITILNNIVASALGGLRVVPRVTPLSDGLGTTPVFTFYPARPQPHAEGPYTATSTRRSPALLADCQLAVKFFHDAP